jgi:DNA-binding response OmpR family regulator
LRIVVCFWEKMQSSVDLTVVVVDPRPDDYAALPQTVHRENLLWKFLVTGCEALRVARGERVDLWVINVALPDMSGIDLCGMLRSRSPSPRIFSVTDVYRAEDEKAAWIGGAALFCCKPVRAEWFEGGLRAWATQELR